MKPYKALAILSLLFSAGCTNIAGDAPRSIYPEQSSLSDADALFSIADDFFKNAGYQCRADQEVRSLRCSRALRDLYIHQTTAVVQVFPEDGGTGVYTLVTTRWDEGLIPGEFISSEFTNPDVKAFCEYLSEEALGYCQG